MIKKKKNQIKKKTIRMEKNKSLQKNQEIMGALFSEVWSFISFSTHFLNISMIIDTYYIQ